MFKWITLLVKAFEGQDMKYHLALGHIFGVNQHELKCWVKMCWGKIEEEREFQHTDSSRLRVLWSELCISFISCHRDFMEYFNSYGNMLWVPQKPCTSIRKQAMICCQVCPLGCFSFFSRPLWMIDTLWINHRQYLNKNAWFSKYDGSTRKYDFYYAFSPRI